MSDVFISYKDQDSDFAESLILHLKNKGFFVLERKTSPSPEKSYISIEQAIRNASILLTVMTPAAKASETVTYEWIFALGAGIPVFTIVRQETELHPRLTVLPHFDFTDPLTPPWEALIEAIEGIVKHLEPHRVPTSHTATPSYIRMAITALDSANAEDRAGAIDNLAQTDHPVAVEALVGALSHPLQDVRTLAALARGNARDIRAIPELLATLRLQDEEISNEAIIALGNIGDATVAPQLVDTMHRRWDRSRYLIADALEKMGSAVVPILQNMLHEENKERKVWATQTLKGFGTAAVSSLIQALQDKERAVKIYAISALSDIGGPDAVSSLIKMLTSDSEEWPIRSNAIEALGKIGDVSAVPSLILALSYNDDGVRRNAAKALRQIGSSAVPSLIEILGTAEGDLRRRINTLLKQIGTPEALSALNTKSRH